MIVILLDSQNYEFEKTVEDFSNSWYKKTTENVRTLIEFGKTMNQNELKIQESTKNVNLKA